MDKDYAVILCFNPSFDGYLKELNIKQQYDTVSPHITIASYKDLDIDAFKKDFHQFFKDIKKIAVFFPSIGFFPQNNTFFLSPTITDTLWTLHRNYHHYFNKYHDESSLYIPNKWVPHCTIMHKVKDEKIMEVFEYTNANYKPITGIIDEIQLISATVDNNKLIDFQVMEKIHLDE